MKPKRVPNWIAASIFFFTASIMLELPSVLRSLMYTMTNAHVGFPPVEQMDLVAPNELSWFGVIGLVLTVLALLVGKRTGPPEG